MQRRVAVVAILLLLASGARAEDAADPVVLARSGSVLRGGVHEISFDGASEVSGWSSSCDFVEFDVAATSSRSFTPKWAEGGRVVASDGGGVCILVGDELVFADRTGRPIWRASAAPGVTSCSITAEGGAVVACGTEFDVGADLLRVIDAKGNARDLAVPNGVRLRWLQSVHDESDVAIGVDGELRAWVVRFATGSLEMTDAGRVDELPVWSARIAERTILVGSVSATVAWVSGGADGRWTQRAVPALARAAAATVCRDGLVAVALPEGAVARGRWADGAFQVIETTRLPAMICALAACAESDRIAAGSRDGMVYLLGNGKPRVLGSDGYLGRRVTLAASRDRRWMLAVDSAGRYLTMESADSASAGAGEAPAERQRGSGLLAPHVNGSHAIAVDDGGRRIAVTDPSGQFVIRRVDASAEDVRIKLADAERAAAACFVTAPSGRQYVVAAVTERQKHPGWSGHGPWDGAGLRCWDADTGRLKWSSMQGERGISAWIETQDLDAGSEVVVAAFGTRGEFTIVSSESGATIPSEPMPIQLSAFEHPVVAAVRGGSDAGDWWVGTDTDGQGQALLLGAIRGGHAFRVRAPFPAPIIDISAAPGGTWTAVASGACGESAIRVIRNSDLTDVRTIPCGDSAPISVLALPGGRIVASTESGEIRMWTVR